MPNAKARYPQLFAFLAAWFAEADLERRSDREVIEAYARVASPADRNRVIAQGRAFLAAKSPPWRQMAEHANRRFADAEAATAWLAQSIKLLEKLAV